MKALVMMAGAIALLPGIAFADNTGGAVGGAVGGGAAGAIVGGPVGAVVGAGVGAILGSSLPPQPSVVYQQPVVVGQALPDDMTYYDVPNQRAYEYVVVNNRRVIVDRHSHKVLRVME